jgi:hypothetical protein
MQTCDAKVRNGSRAAGLLCKNLGFCAADFDQGLRDALLIGETSAYITADDDDHPQYDHGNRDQARHGGGRGSRL